MTGHGSTSAFPELPADGWRSATRCGPNGGNCVEVNLARANSAHVIGVRDSKPGVSPVLTFDRASWRSFLGATIRGDI
ncbi:MAG TPA: DUF397 domain-containing protein [Pseudonocardiaceae bacterium]|nr:DUF397 domain-containing protein [Pseudonocardiaceae bacterium]